MPIKLTKRQAEIVELKAIGKNNDVIARRVGIARNTVDAHLCAAMRRCNCKTWKELVDWWWYSQNKLTYI